MAKLVSKTYGDALFELALELDKIDIIQEEVEVILQVLKTNEEFIKIMSHPRISVEEKSSILENVFKGKVSDEVMGFLMTIEDKGRFQEINSILTYFVDKVREYKKIGVAYVTSATALTDSQKKAIESRLLETTSYVSFLMEYDVNPALIGGMVVRIGDRVVDSSIKCKLDNMAKELSKIQLKN